MNEATVTVRTSPGNCVRIVKVTVETGHTSVRNLVSADVLSAVPPFCHPVRKCDSKNGSIDKKDKKVVFGFDQPFRQSDA
jgi:hypothetical protein